MTTETIQDLVRKAETEYESGKTIKSKYVTVSLKDDIEKIDAYANSKHISGETDSLGREKPFFNIVIAAMNIWYRATDIDRANINIRATRSSDHILQIFYNAKVQEWMKTAKFGVFLNKWGRTLSKYGSAVVEFVEKDGELVPSVLDWNNIIVDSIAFDHAPLIKKIYYTPSQLKKQKNYDQKLVDELLTSLETRKTLGRQSKDTKADSILVYEVHGELSLAQYKQARGEEVKDGDENEFFHQMHAISYVRSGRRGANRNEYEDYTLFVGKEDNPHMITHLIEEDGYILSMGAVKSLFEAQWMTNHNEKNIKDYLDLVSKLLLQTDDDSFMGKNAVENLVGGEFIIHKSGMPLVPVQMGNSSGALPELRNDMVNWKNQSMEVTSTPDALRGNTMPSGTPAILAEQLAQQSSSLFEIMLENKGLALEEMMTRFVLPFIDKTMTSSDEIMATLSDEGIKQFDSMYVPNEAIRRYNKQAGEQILNGELPSPYKSDIAEQAIQQELAPMGRTRPLSPEDIKGQTWKELFKGFKKRVEVEVTNEMHNKSTLLSDLNATLANLVRMGDVENARMVLGKILEETSAISPAEMKAIQSAPAPQPNAPQPLPVGGSNVLGG